MAQLTDDEREYYSLVKRVFDILAPFYDVLVMPFSKSRSRVVEFTGAAKGSKILDVATGTGKQAFAYAKRAYDVVGVDLSEGMVKVADRKNRYRNAKFQVADAASLPFEDNSFDVVSVSFALHTMPPIIRQKSLHEMARVTNRAGTMVIVDFALPLNRIGRYLVYNLVKAPMGKHFAEFTHSDLEGLLKESGIDMIEERRVILGAVRILKGIKVDDPAKLKPLQPAEDIRRGKPNGKDSPTGRQDAVRL